MDTEILLEVKELEKRYSGTAALKGVSMQIKAGEIVGLVGENGAGKSTLLKLIMGVERPTSGTMTARGELYAPRNTREASTLGVGMVFQEQSLIPNLTVGQNIYLGKEKLFSKAGVISWKKMYAHVQEYLKSLQIEGISAGKKILDYMFSSRQMVEIARVLNTVQESGHDKTLILLDEPTSVLSDKEIQQLFGYMKKLKADGHSVVFVSHRLDEILNICDYIYVFKDGQKVGYLSADEADEATLYRMMVGNSTIGEYYHLEKQKQPSDEVVLELEGVGLKGACKDISFQLHKGEILGICGVTGSGKEDVCAILCGDVQNTSGQIRMDGKPVKFRQPYDALKKGILSVPKERREEAICESLSVMENIFFSNYEAAKKGGVISSSRQREIAREQIEKLGIKCSGEKDLLEQLSGGNAQKVVFARALLSGANVLILNHPTRGVDIGAKMELYSIIREQVLQGMAIVLLGDTLEECIGLSNRLLVMKDGLITKEYDAPPENKPTQMDIIRYMM